MPSQDKLIRIVLRMQDEYSKQAEQAASATEKLSGKMKSVGAGMTSIGQKMSVGLTAPIVAGAAGAIKAFTGFQDKMAEIGARTGATADELERLRKFALKMGADTKFSASEAAEAMLQLTASGYGATEAIATLPAVLDLAAAGALDLGVAADGVTDVIKEFGLAATDAGRVADALARASGSSSATVQDLIDAFENGGNVAKSYGFSIEEASAALAVMAENGIKGSEAGTKLKSMLIAMSRPTKDVGAAWNRLGTSMYDAQGMMRPIDDILKDINRGLQGMTDQERNNTLKTLAGSYGLVAMNALLASDGISDMQGAMSNAASASEVAQARMGTLSGRFESLMGSLETLGITLGFLSEGPLTSFLEKLTQGVNAVTRWVEANPKLAQLIIIILGIVAALGPVLIILGQIVGAIGTLITAWGAVSTAVAGFSAALPAIGAAVGAISLPVLALVAAFGALVAVVIHFKDELAAWGFVFQSIGQLFKMFVQTSIEGWKSILPAFSDAFNQLLIIAGIKIWQLGQVIWKGITEIGQIIWKGITDGVNFIREAFSILFTGNFLGIASIDQIAWLWNIRQELESFANWIMTPITFIRAAWNILIMGQASPVGTPQMIIWLWTIRTEINNFLQWIQTIPAQLGTLFQNLFAPINNFIATFRQQLEYAKGTGVGFFKVFEDGSTRFQALLMAMGMTEQRAMALGAALANAGATIGNAWSNMASRVKQALDGLMGILKSFGQAPIATMKALGKLIMDGFIEGFKSAASKFLAYVTDMAKKLQNTVKKAFKIRSPSKVMMELGSQVGEGFNQGVQGMGNLSPTVPQLTSAAGVGGGFGGGNVYIQNVNVPPGTTREQVDAIMKELGKRSKLRGARAIP